MNDSEIFKIHVKMHPYIAPPRTSPAQGAGMSAADGYARALEQGSVGRQSQNRAVTAYAYDGWAVLLLGAPCAWCGATVTKGVGDD